MESKPQNFLANIFKKRSVNDIIERAKSNSVERTLNWFDIIILGISAVIGSGIFVMVGEATCGNAEHVGAGPALIISIIIAAVACIFPALCYAEFASAIPDSGSSYTYMYTTMGEFVAWITGWLLVLEYSICNITISIAWSKYLFHLLAGFEKFLPSWIVNPPVWLVNDYAMAVQECKELGLNPDVAIPKIFGIPFSINLPAIVILLIIACILTKGTKESKRAAQIMVFIKLAVVFLFIGVAAFYVKPENWVPFAPNGFQGIILGTFIIFYAYLGFDALATTAEETKNPQKDLPIGIIGTLVIVALVYCLMALAFTGIVPVSQYGIIDIQAPIAHATRLIHQDWFAGWISLGALAALTSVILVLQFANSRILYAMTRDNFLPRIFKLKHSKYKTPYVSIWATTIVIIIFGTFIDMSVAAQLCIFATLSSFILICVGIIISRKIHPNIERPFKMPLCPLLPILGILICVFLVIRSVPDLSTSSILFPLWILLGSLIYGFYGYRKNRKIELKNIRLLNEKLSKGGENE